MEYCSQVLHDSGVINLEVRWKKGSSDFWPKLNIVKTAANRPISIYQNSASNKRPQYEALGNKYRVCGVYSKEPRSEVYCL